MLLLLSSKKNGRMVWGGGGCKVELMVDRHWICSHFETILQREASPEEWGVVVANYEWKLCSLTIKLDVWSSSKGSALTTAHSWLSVGQSCELLRVNIKRTKTPETKRHIIKSSSATMRLNWCACRTRTTFHSSNLPLVAREKNVISQYHWKGRAGLPHNSSADFSVSLSSV